MRGFTPSASSTLALGSLLLASSANAQLSAISSGLVSAASSGLSSVVASASSTVSSASSALSSASASITASSSQLASASASSTAASSAASASSTASGSAPPATATGAYAIPFVVAPDIPVDTSTPYNYTEEYRNQFHYSPPKGWGNDPNGLVYYEGTYHFFYQYNPARGGLVAANQSWGHATSKDLVTWENLPVAIVATENELIFSGSAVVDYNNTSNFGSSGSPALVAIYATAHIENNNLTRQAISVAYSTDNGTTFTKYQQGAPVIDLGVNDLRDPNVKWHQPTDGSSPYWLLSAVLAEQYQVTFYRSDDLKNWTHLSDYGPGDQTTGGVWECPDLFTLPDPTNPSQNISVLIVSVNPGGIAGGSGTWYILGDFTNGTFTPSDRAQAGTRENWIDYGADNYAGITYTDAPEPTFHGWMSNWWYGQEVPTSPWRSAYTVPRTLSLRQTANGTLQLHQEPIYQLGQLYSPSLPSTFGYEATDVTQSLDGVSGETLRLEAVVSVGNATNVGFNVRVGDGQATAIGFNASASEVYIDRSRSGNATFNETVFPVYHGGPIQLEGGVVKFTILVDWASVEVFAESGSQTVLTDIIFPSASSTGVEFYASGGTAQLVSLQASNVSSIWGPGDVYNGGNSTSASSASSASTQTGVSGPVSTGSASPASSATISASSASGSTASAAPAASTQSPSATGGVASATAAATGAVSTGAALVSSAGAAITQPVASIAQRYARAILRPDM